MKYLIVGPSWVGDMVMAQVLFLLIKQQQPNAIIDVISPAWNHALLSRMPEVNRAIESNIKHGELVLFKRYQIGKRLTANKYNIAITLPNSLKSALIPYWAKINKRIGWVGECRYILLNDIRKLNKNRYPMMVQRYAALAFEKDKYDSSIEIPIPKLIANKENRNRFLQNNKLDCSMPILALCPGAEFGVSKKWPEKHFAEVANHFIKKNWNVWIFGSSNDISTAKTIKNLIPINMQQSVNIIAGKTSLGDAIDLLATAELVISNDSGLMHIAAALNRNLIAIYGSSSPKFTPPLNKNKKILHLDISCSPCFKKQCPLKHHKCMQTLMPSMIIDAAKQIQNTINL